MAYCLVYFGYYNPRWGLQHTSGSIGKDSKHILRVPPCFTSLGLYSFQWMQKYNDRSLLSHGKRDARRPTRERKQSIPRSARRHPLSGDLMWRNPGPEYLKSNDSHGNQRKRQTSRNTETVDHSWEVINTGYSEEGQCRAGSHLQTGNDLANRDDGSTWLMTSVIWLFFMLLFYILINWWYVKNQCRPVICLNSAQWGFLHISSVYITKSKRNGL